MYRGALLISGANLGTKLDSKCNINKEYIEI